MLVSIYPYENKHENDNYIQLRRDKTISLSWDLFNWVKQKDVWSY